MKKYIILLLVLLSNNQIKSLPIGSSLGVAGVGYSLYLFGKRVWWDINLFEKLNDDYNEKQVLNISNFYCGMIREACRARGKLWLLSYYGIIFIEPIIIFGGSALLLKKFM